MILLTAAMLLAGSVMAQTDTLKQDNDPDTLKVGNFVIIKKKKDKDDGTDGEKGSKSVSISLGSNKKENKNNVSTNWFIFDLGFANLRDETNYGSAETMAFLQNAGHGTPTKQHLKLNSGKSSNVNIWLFMQKVNVTKHVLNLKYGLGLEMYNYRYENNISYHNNPTYIFVDSTTFKKNKLYAGYLTVPFMININATPSKKRGFSFSAGMSAGYLIGARQKQVSDLRGKEKLKSNFNLEQWRLAAIGEIGLGPVRVYGSYSLNPLHENGLQQYPYTVGIRFSNW